jgi:prepilin-type N-terminal cleavage/methylation domain-containing protein
MSKLFFGSHTRGFTIVELLVVIVIIGILATLGVVAYNGITSSARDNAVLSDLDGVESEIVRYSTDNNGEYGSAVEWYSGESANNNINFALSMGTILDVTASENAYCIRAYNPAGRTYTSLSNAAVRESDSGACDDLPASDIAVAVDTGTGGNTVKQLGSTNNNTTCAVTVAGAAYCWGIGTSGQLGDGASSSSSVPVAVSTAGVLSGKSLKQLTMMSNSVCGLATDGAAYCWGVGTAGQLGNSVSSNSPVPVAVSTSGVLSGKAITKITSGNGSICVIASDSKGYCWGTGSFGRLGNNSTSDSSIPVAVSTAGVLSGKTLKQIVVGSGMACAIASDSKVYCWGYNASGQLGNNSTTDSSVPVAVSTSGVLSGKSLKQIALVSGGSAVCALDTNGVVYCWGSGGLGMLGNNSTSNSSVPVAVSTAGVLSGKVVKEMFTNEGSYICVLDTDNNLYCWGYNANGQLGNNSTTNSSVPVAVSTAGVLSGKTVKEVRLGGAQACVIASDDLPYCWGLGTSGQLGNGAFSSSSIPVAVSTAGSLSGKTVNELMMKSEVACVVASDNNTYCWGWGSGGQIGNGSTSSISQPSAALNIGL